MICIEEQRKQYDDSETPQVDQLKFSKGGSGNALTGGLCTFAQHLC